MIHHLGPFVRRGEMTISENNRFEGWLQLYGQDTLIRFELDSQESSALAGCQFSFKPTSNAPQNPPEIPDIHSIQFGKLIALQINNVEPPMFTHNHVELRADGEYRADFQLVWESQDEIIDVAINSAQFKMHWKDAQLKQSEDLPESMLPAPIRQSIRDRIDQIDKAYGDDSGEFLISVKMPTESQLEDLATVQLQTIVHKVENGPQHRMIEFMKEISEQDKNILICDLLEPPIKTPSVEDMSTDALQDKVLEILSRLSTLGVEFRRCEHFDNPRLYDWLVNKVIPWERVHPQLQHFQMTRFFDTSLWCDECGIYQQL